MKSVSRHGSTYPDSFCFASAYRATSFSSSQIAELRKKPDPHLGSRVSPSTFRQAEEQSLAALAAVSQARATMAAIEDESRWGVVSGATFFGRATIAQTVRKYSEEGPWGVSPHAIPQFSLHAPSATISLALKSHGPNFGVGGGAEGTRDAFLLASAMLEEFGLPGVWLTLTGREREWLPDDQGTACPDDSNPVHALAFALTPQLLGASGLGIRVRVEDGFGSTDSFHDRLPPFSLAELAEELAQPSPSGVWRLPGCGWVEVERRHRAESAMPQLRGERAA